jgi:cell division protein FtsB
MRRYILLLGICIVVLSIPGVGAAQCESPTNGTVSEVCSQVDELEQENADLRAENTNLESEIEELEFEVEQGGEFPAPMAQRMNQTGAVDPQTGEPALVVIRETRFFPIVYQYVGPENGQHSFNGRNAWIRVAESEEAQRQVEGEGSFTFSVEYANPGMNTTYTAQSMGEYHRILREIQGEMNTPQGYTSYTYWTNQQRQGAESIRSGLWLTVVVGLVGVAWGAAQYESKHHSFERRREERRAQQAAGQVNAFGGALTPREQFLYIAEKYKVPIALGIVLVVGWVVL